MRLAALRRICSLASPPRCAVCASPGEGGEAVCERCRRALAASAAILAPGPPGVEVAVAAAPFDGAARELVHALKFGRRLSVARVAARAMARAAREFVCDLPEAAIVPVPADPVRWRWRGFDPAEELAIALSAELDLPVARCLRRRPGPRQVGRSRAARLRTPPVVEPRGDAPRHAVLVDDVWTTGATLSASARALRLAGAQRVAALALARTSPLPRRAPGPTIPITPTEGGDGP